MAGSFDPRPFLATGSLRGRNGGAETAVEVPTGCAVDDATAPVDPTDELDRVTTVGVVGLGVMGRGIAVSLALGGHQVVCRDLDAALLTEARQAVVSGRYGLERLMTRADGEYERSLEQVVDALSFTTDLRDLGDAEVVVESVPEDLALKMELFRELDHVLPPGAILASNSSGLPITALGLATERADKVVGWHWSSPAPVMPFAEIVRSEATSEHTVQVVCALARGCGKTPVVIRDQPHQWGFVANRVYFAMIREALRVVEEGVATEAQVDRLMVDCFNWPVGPLSMLSHARRGWE